MQALIDADILRYEIGFSGQWKDDEGVLVMRDWEFVKELLDMKIAGICEDVEADEVPVLYLTDDTTINRMRNRERKREGLKPLALIANFRDKIAVTKVYKGTRKGEKPLHFNNLTAYMLENYLCEVSSGGLEADDEMCIEQTSRLGKGDTIICSRDKDLRICQGLHYSWECGKQAAIGPFQTDRVGSIEDKGGKVFGTGLSFFYSQLLTGDGADNIPGLPRCGPVAALKALEGAVDEASLFASVSELYKNKLEEGWEAYMREQADLLWMVQELTDKGERIMYEWPEVLDES